MHESLSIKSAEIVDCFLKIIVLLGNEERPINIELGRCPPAHKDEWDNEVGSSVEQLLTRPEIRKKLAMKLDVDFHSVCLATQVFGDEQDRLRNR